MELELKPDLKSNLTSNDIDLILKKNDFFYDKDFKPDVISLINFDDDALTDKEKIFWNTLQWKRISEIFGPSIFLMKNASFRDPIQGSIGNCYLMSVCSVIAEYSNRLKNIFTVKEANKAGIYGVMFYIDGINTQVIVDDFIPIYPSTNKLVFAKLPISRNIWPIILEKAWAKRSKNYQNTISGSPSILLQILTGAPSESYLSNKFVIESEINTFWKKLQNYFYSSYFICASTNSNMLDIEKIGLQENHAYSVLFLEEFEVNGYMRKLVKLRNPWGVIDLNKLRNGNIKQSHLKVEEVKINIGKEEDGVFILTFEEFLQYFSAITVCKYIDNYSPVSVVFKKNQIKNNQHFISLKIDLRNAENTKNKIFFSVNKPTTLNFIKGEEKKNNKVKREIFSSIFLGKYTNNGKYKFLNFACGNESSNIIELENYEKIEYILLIHLDENKSKFIDVLGSLSIYTLEKNINISENYSVHPCHIFTQLIYDYYCEFRPSFHENIEYLNENQLVTYNSFHLLNSFYTFILLENLSDHCLWYKFSNIELYDTIEGGGTIAPKSNYFYEDELEKGQFFLLANFKTSLKYKYSTEVRLNRDALIKLVKSNGKENRITFKNSTILIKNYSHNYGIVLYIRNNYFQMLNLIINLELENYFCNENPENIINLFAETENDYFYFFEKIDRINQSSISWRTNIFELV